LKKKSKYKCPKHKSNEGFYDSKGNWICWKCYYENEFLNPKGKVLDSFKHENYLIRLIDTGNEVRIEIWNTETKERISSTSYRYLSVAMREFKRYIQDILTNPFRRNSTRILVRDLEFENQILINLQLENCTLKNCILINCITLNCNFVSENYAVIVDTYKLLSEGMLIVENADSIPLKILSILGDLDSEIRARYISDRFEDRVFGWTIIEDTLEDDIDE